MTKLLKLGKAIVDKQDDGDMLVFLPDGDIARAASAIEAEAIIIKWQIKRTPLRRLAAVDIEWRGCKPPKKGQR